MKNIDDHIEEDIKLLDDVQISSQSRRHIEQELVALKLYKEKHPDDQHDPTSLELFCDDNPGAIECKIYED